MEVLISVDAWFYIIDNCKFRSRVNQFQRIGTLTVGLSINVCHKNRWFRRRFEGCEPTENRGK
ncbi:MAG: hypothetical protein CV081_08350 [Nitrospira sp. LK265]|nr:hypothetical protein [Nitrospira sp. LK265]